MPEYIGAQDNHMDLSYFLNPEEMLSDVHHLVCIFLANEKLVQWSVDNQHQKLIANKLFERDEDQINKLLLRLAINGRVIDDKNQEIKKYFQGEDVCGLFSDGKKLNFRDACNKIIHAKTIRYDMDYLVPEIRYLNPKIYLYGSQNSKSWKVELDIMEYASLFVAFCC